MIKKSFNKVVTLLALAALMTSCASINSKQERELAEWEAKGIMVKEKDETTAAVLNVLPGIGDFYNGNVGYGILNLAFWPSSILWAPFGGVSGAKEKNYFATKAYISELTTKKNKLIVELDNAFMTETITKKIYLIGKRKISVMDISEFKDDIKLSDIIPLTTQRIPANK